MRIVAFGAFVFLAVAIAAALSQFAGDDSSAPDVVLSLAEQHHEPSAGLTSDTPGPERTARAPESDRTTATATPTPEPQEATPTETPQVETETPTAMEEAAAATPAEGEEDESSAVNDSEQELSPGPTPEREAEPTPAPAQDQTSMSDAERQMLQLHNDARARQGLAALRSGAGIQRLAERRCAEVARNFSHDGWQQALAESGLRYVIAGENIAGVTDVRRAFDGWMASPGHRENILRPSFSTLGIAQCDGVWVAEFLG